MSHCQPSSATPIIPLESHEKTWEWHVASDALFLSRGTREALGLDERTAPATMSELLGHVAEGCLQTLHELREGVLTGHKGSFLETAYPVEGFFIRERLMVVERDADGRASRVIGQYEIASGASSYLPPVSQAIKEMVGFWTCSLFDGTLRLDGTCSTLLGYADSLSRSFSLDEWKTRMHPDEGDFLERYHLAIEQPLFGDEITDELRVRREDGTYARLWVHGSILERDRNGRARSMSGTLRNTVSHENSQELRKPENGSLLSAINSTGDGLWDWNPITDEVYYSPRWLSMLGYTSEQFPGHLDTWKVKIHPEDLKKIVEPQRKLADSPAYGDTFECTYRLMRADGTYAWILGRGYVTHRDENGRATRIVGLHTNITASQADRDYFEKLAQNDALTGLHSRTYFDMKLANIENRHIRPLSVISCDVNGLKLANDYMGHLVGDKLLQSVAALCKESVRVSDCVARMGGDEIVILLPECPRDKAEAILANMRAIFERHNACSDQMPALVSFGLACADTTDTPASAVLVQADREMLKEKRERRKADHLRIKQWIEQNMDVVVSLEEDRY